MKIENRRLVLEQIDRKLLPFVQAKSIQVPERGWIHSIRIALKIPLSQLARRMGVARQTIRAYEIREAEGSVTLKSLREIAKAMNLTLVYALVPNEDSLEQLIERQAEKIARSIVLRTSKSMELEEQNVSRERIEKAIRAKTEELIRTMPRYLWD